MDSLRALGLVLVTQGDYAGARVYLERALQMSRQDGDRRGEASTLRELGVAFWKQGDYAGARACHEESLRACRETGDRHREGLALVGLGGVSVFEDDCSGALDYSEQALRIFREIGDRVGQVRALDRLSMVSVFLGDYARAMDYFERALLILREAGTPHQHIRALFGLSLVYMDLGDYAGARAHAEQMPRISRETGEWVALPLAFLGLLSHHLGDDQAAREYSQEAQQALHTTQEIDRHVRGYTLSFLGHVLVGLGQLAEAASVYRQGLDIRRELSQPHLATEPLAGLARVSLTHEDPTQALVHVEEILSHVETRPTLEGTYEPFRVYLTCYRVLRANQDPRAGDILDTAHRLLQERAAKIPDEELRRSFLENVAAHREIIEAWEAL